MTREGDFAMAKTTQFDPERVEGMIDRFQLNGLETLNLGFICFRFVPALHGINLTSVMYKLSSMLKHRALPLPDDSCRTDYHFIFYANFIQYLINRGIKFDVYYQSKGRTLMERIGLYFLCRQLNRYQRDYERKVFPA